VVAYQAALHNLYLQTFSAKRLDTQLRPVASLPTESNEVSMQDANSKYLPDPKMVHVPFLLVIAAGLLNAGPILRSDVDPAPPAGR